MLASCAKEDTPKVSFTLPSNYFAPASEDQGAEAQLRRQFFELTGCYLLFNDTLQHDSLGVDINGEPRYFTETLDLSYSVGQSNAVETFYRFTLLQTDEQKKAMTGFLQDYVLTHLTKQLRPYSFFVCDVINSYKNSYSSPTKPYSVSNQRCIAIAGNYLVQRERTDAQKEQYAQRILNGVIAQLATNNSAAFGDFFKFSAQYYSADYSKFGYAERPSATELYQLGFLSSTALSTFPSMSTDLGSYALLVIQKTDEELQATYGSYPIILEKAAVVRQVIVELGYVF